MTIVGLTGGIASGKSTVARMLEQKGARVLDADNIAREIMVPGSPAWQEIVVWLGSDYLHKDGSLDRAKLGDLIFHEENARLKLNKIIHPKIKQVFLDNTREIKNAEPSAVLVFDAPLLLEAGMADTVDIILLVYASPEVQLKRLQKRDGLSRENALKRINSQMPIQEKKNFAHSVIDNDGSLKNTAKQVDCFWSSLSR